MEVVILDSSDKICTPNKTDYGNLHVFNLITRMNESKALKDIFYVTVNVNLKMKNVFQSKT